YHCFFFFQAEDGIRDRNVTGVQTCALPISLPNTVLMMPKDEIEAAQMIDLSLRHEGPAAIRYPRGNVKGLDMGEQREPLRLGEWEEVVSGENMAIISFGPNLDLAIDASAALKEAGIDARVINARFIQPLDEKMLLALGVSNMPLVTVE